MATARSQQPRVLLLWTILWVLLAPVISFRNSIAHGDINVGQSLFVSAMIAVPLAIIGLIVWGVIKLVMKMSLHRTEIGIKVAVGIWLIFFVILFMLPLFRKPSNSSSSKVNQEYQSGVMVLDEVNNQRAQKGLPLIEVDEKLCAFARKKALELALGNSQKTLTVEIQDPANNVYFVGYENVMLDSIQGGLLSGDEDFAQTFMSDADGVGNQLAVTHGCVADSAGSGSSNGAFYTVFVGASKQ